MKQLPPNFVRRSVSKKVKWAVSVLVYSTVWLVFSGGFWVCHPSDSLSKMGLPKRKKDR